MLERSLEYLIGELVAGARSAGGKVTHVLQHGVEAHARLLTQLILNHSISYHHGRRNYRDTNL
jgi:hypothetical protein